MQGVEHDLTADAWTMVAFNSSAAIVVPTPGARVRGRKDGEAEPALDATHFLIQSMRIIHGIAPFEALWLRADAGPVTVTVYEGNSMTGVVYFGKSPFRLTGPSSTTITVPFVPQTLDGGTPDMDYAGYPVIDCGGPVPDPNLRTIDGRSAGENP